MQPTAGCKFILSQSRLRSECLDVERQNFPEIDRFHGVTLKTKKTLRRQPLSSIEAIYKSGMIQGQEPTPGGIRVKAEAPLSAMFGYIGDLRTMTSGRGQFSMEFSHYAPCPRNVSDEVIAKAKDEALRTAK